MTEEKQSSGVCSFYKTNDLYLLEIFFFLFSLLEWVSFWDEGLRWKLCRNGESSTFWILDANIDEFEARFM